MHQKHSSLLIALFAAFSLIAYAVPTTLGVGFSSIVLTVSTFLFAVLTGFFISRQSTRYSNIRQAVANFDGSLSALYRGFDIFKGEGAQEKMAEILRRHYAKIVETGEWDWHFKNRSTTITDIGNLLLKTVGDRNLTSGPHLVVRDMVARVDNLQIARKEMVGLEIERMPRFQWMLTYYLASLLLISIMLIPSTATFYDALLKGAFATLVVFVVILLRELDGLHLFEGVIGTASAKDVLEIIEGKK